MAPGVSSKRARRPQRCSVSRSGMAAGLTQPVHKLPSSAWARSAEAGKSLLKARGEAQTLSLAVCLKHAYEA